MCPWVGRCALFWGKFLGTFFGGFWEFVLTFFGSFGWNVLVLFDKFCRIFGTQKKKSVVGDIFGNCLTWRLFFVVEFFGIFLDFLGIFWGVLEGFF